MVATQISSHLSLFQLEKIRYSRKGLANTLLAVLLLALQFCGTYKLGEAYWPKTLTYRQSYLFYFVFACLGHTLIAVLCFLFYLPAYRSNNSFLEKYKINDSQWQWNRQNWQRLKSSTIKGLLLSHLVYYPTGIFISMFRNLNFSFPTFQEFVVTIFICLYLEDMGFFTMHRLFHHPYFYKKFHKQHHEYDNPFSSASEFAHPVEYFLCNLLPSSLSLTLLGSRLHVFSYVMFIFFRIINTNEVHSGFQFHFSPMRVLPFSNASSTHNFHHSKNSGVYGSFTYLWDYMTGNYYDYADYYYKAQLSQQSGSNYGIQKGQ